MWIQAFQRAQKPVYRYSIIVSFAFSAIASFPQLLKHDTYMVAFYYLVVPYLQRCYVSLATSKTAHNY